MKVTCIKYDQLQFNHVYFVAHVLNGQVWHYNGETDSDSIWAKTQLAAWAKQNLVFATKEAAQLVLDDVQSKIQEVTE